MKLFSKKDTCVMDNAEVINLKWKAMQYDKMYKVLMRRDDIYSDPKFDSWLTFYDDLYTPGVSLIKALQSFASELRAELNLSIRRGDKLKDQNECPVKGDNLIETIIRLNEENGDLSKEIKNMNEKLGKRDKEIERLKKDLEYQKLKNSKLTDANVKQFETIMQRNAEVGALKHMLDRLEEKE